MIEIPLKCGKIALIDAQDEKHVSNYKWTWDKNHGVAALDKKQCILLHNLISPFSRVSFKDGNKLNCRRNNLIRFKGGKGRVREKAFRIRKDNKTGETGITEGYDKGSPCLRISRSIIRDRLYSYQTRVNYGKRSRAEAMVLAKERRDWLNSMSRNEFVDFVVSRQRNMTGNQIISDWSVFDGRELSKEEFYQLGVSFRPED